VISSEASFKVATKNSKSSRVRVVLNVVLVALYFIWDQGFGGVTFLFLDGSSSSLGGVTSPLFFSTSVTPSSPPSSPYLGEIEVVFVDVLWTSCTSSYFFILLCPGFFDIVLGLSTSDIFVGSTGTRRSTDHSLVISSKSFSVLL
jgi:hypothetical protein